MTTMNNIQSAADRVPTGINQASTSMAAAWQLSPHQLDAARKVLQHVQRSFTAQAGPGNAQQVSAQQ